MTNSAPTCHAGEINVRYPLINLKIDTAMIFLRAFLIVVVLVFFFVVATPMQWLLARLESTRADAIPLLFCRTFLRILRVSVELSGDRFARGPLLLVVNHVSWIDILVLGSLTPFCFLAKREIAAWPLISSLARMQGTVFIDRGRRRGIPPANEQMAHRMREGRIVLLFPEGTTLGDVTPGPFHSSHFAAARDLLRLDAAQQTVLVQPTALAYSSVLAAWIGEEALVPHIWRVLRGKPLKCHVAFCAPIPFTRDSDRKAVARSSREVIIAALARLSVFAADEPRDVVSSNASSLDLDRTAQDSVT